jgi:hypothetical protein
MIPLPKARGIPPLTQAKTAGAAWHKLLAEISKSDFVAIIAFCMIGLLSTLNVILRFPDFGSLIELYNKF